MKLWPAVVLSLLGWALLALLAFAAYRLAVAL